MSLKDILTKTISPNQIELKAAQQYLEQLCQQNLPEFLKQLSEILSNIGCEPFIRQQAALQLKNQLTSKDIEIQRQFQQRWLAFPEDVRSYVKQNVINALGTEQSRPSSAAQCVAYIGVAELPHNFWPELIPILTQNVTNANSTEMMKESTLEAIGYICQEIDPEILVAQSNNILTAIVHGMRRDETSNNVKLAATTALCNSLEFTKANFDKDTERHFIMQVVCEGTQCPDIKVKVSALQCLVKIMSLYYQHMEQYMGPALFAITMQAMRSEHDEIALQGIEFWSNVCDEETDLSIEATEAAEQGRPPTRTSKFYAKGALQYLVPILMQTLTKQEESDDEDDWNPCKAAGVCLMLMSACTEDAIIPHVLPFVKDNISHQDWRFRDAAVMAFGCILEGPDCSALRPLVDSALPTLIVMMKDQCVIVRDTVAWTIGRICEITPESVLRENVLKQLLDALLEGLRSEPRVAANVCWAFNSLSEAAIENVQETDGTEPKTYGLSPYFQLIVQKLLECTERQDGGQANLRSAAYEALMEMIKNSATDCYPIVQSTTMIILERLNHVLSLENHIDNMQADRSQVNDLQSLLCATLQSVLRKMTPEDAPRISDAIMTALLQMFNASGKSGGVQEDALMAVGTLIETLGDGFLKYMDVFRPFLILGLRNYAEYQVCTAAVGLVGDICRSISGKILPYCDELMTVLIENLSNNAVHRSVKPQILSVFGDISLAIGTEFKKYLDVVLQTLMQATQIQADPNDFELVDYVNELRENCLEAYTGIVQGLKGDAEVPNPEVQLILPHVPYMAQFVTLVASDAEITDTLISSCSGLIGDLCVAFGNVMIQLVDNEHIQIMLNRGKKSKNTKARTLTIWAIKEIKKLKGVMNATPGL
ncbi:importin subunit beta-1-like [Oppia nitens]|uniref:importin subunit beta-1-like n=1 Tax=Oppia nitens TaxID=1686743 RepID=UPI0023DAF57F|nr:importin subunit beta-1-like [Oppia nitens]